jgi:hypothetical protein
MLTDSELGVKIKEIFHSPMTWQGQSAAIQALKPECGDMPDENTIGSRARNASLLAKQAAENDTKKAHRTAPGRKPELRDPPRYVEDKAEEPKPKRKTFSSKKATRKKA